MDTSNLTYLDDMFEEAEEAAGGGERVPDGEYAARVDAVEFTLSRDGNKPMLKWDLVIVDGEYENRHLFRNNMMATQQNMGYLKRDLKTVGIDIYAEGFKLLNFLQTRLGELLDRVIRVSVATQKNDPSRYNVYLNELLEVPNGALVGAGAGANSDDPFMGE